MVEELTAIAVRTAIGGHPQAHRRAGPANVLRNALITPVTVLACASAI